MQNYSIAFPHDRRFDDRILRNGDDAVDFEDFVRDCLNAEADGALLLRRLARGRDGAIDLLSEENGATWVVECKFQARATTTDPDRRWAEVQANLDRNLPALAADPSKHSGSPYRRSLDRENPVGRYTFCIAAPMTQPNVDALCATIRVFFNRLSGDAALTHLAAIEVEVLSWDHFHAVAGAHPALRFHWFGGLPPGIQPLEAAPGREPSFRDFLSTLPYVSRQDFLAERAGARVETEAALLDRLAEDRELAALVVSGPGGVGKTRLALELGRGLRDRGWLVVRVDRQAPATSVEALIRTHRVAGRVAFLLDYAEAAAQLDGIAAALGQGAADGGHRLRLIATCRASGQHPVEDGLVDLDPEVRTVAGPVGDETAFADWVTRRILVQGNLPEQEALAAICNGLPALAAFAVFLHRHQPESFDAQFRNLVGLTDFKSWATRRIALLTRDATAADDDRRSLADLALGLPMSVEARDAVIDRGGRPAVMLRRLEDDRWVEGDGGLVAAAHDVMADALAAHWLVETEVAATRRVADALRRAADGGLLDTTLRAVDRLAAHPTFEAIDGITAVRSVHKARPEATMAALADLLRGRLMNPEAKLELLAEAPDLRDQVRLDHTLDGAILYLVEHAARAMHDAPARTHAESLIELLDLAVARASSKKKVVLRRAYAVLPGRYREQMIAHVRASPTGKLTVLFLVALLKTGEPSESLADAVALWFAAHGLAAEASHVLKAWLAAEGPAEAVRQQACDWVKANAKLLDAGFVIKHVAGFNDLPDDVLIAIATWAELHATDPDAADRLSRVGRYLDRESTGEVARRMLLRSSLIVLFQAGNGGLPDDEWARFSVGMLCSRVTHVTHNEPAHSALSDFVLAQVVATGLVLTPGTDLRPDPWLWIAMHRALEAGFLDIERHASGIEAFVGWLREQEDPDGMIATFLARMARAFPSPVWG